MLTEDAGTVQIALDDPIVAATVKRACENRQMKCRVLPPADRSFHDIALEVDGCLVIGKRCRGETVQGVLDRLAGRASPLSVVAITPSQPCGAAASLLSRGAFSVFSWPCDLDALCAGIRIAIDRSHHCAKIIRMWEHLDSRFVDLSDLELRMVAQLITGKPYKRICREFKISERTLERRKRLIFEKTRVKSIAALSAAFSSWKILQEVRKGPLFAERFQPQSLYPLFVKDKR